MNHSKDHITYLWKRFVDDKASWQELQELLTYLRENQDNEYDISVLERYLSTIPNTDTGNKAFWDEGLQSILAHKPYAMSANTERLQPVAATESGPSERRRRIFPPWLRYAAAVVLLCGGAAAYLLHTGKQKTTGTRTAVAVQSGLNDVQPGGNRAILTLANGSQIVLDSAANGILGAEGQSTIRKSADGQIIYVAAAATSPESVVYNTMRTPAGGQYQVILPDGSQVWLNALSSIRYPTAFTGHERSVEITGEAYFEIKKNRQMPFVVKAGEHTTVEVLGTSFNVNAYTDEPDTKTTLLEGAVNVSEGAWRRTLAAGQQALSGRNTAITVMDNVDTEEVMAWRNGAFSFRDAGIQTVMRQLSRWYNVEVRFEGKIPTGNFSGEIGRSLTLQQVLTGLSETRINFRIEGRVITILSEKN